MYTRTSRICIHLHVHAHAYMHEHVYPYVHVYVYICTHMYSILEYESVNVSCLSDYERIPPVSKTCKSRLNACLLSIAVHCYYLLSLLLTVIHWYLLFCLLPKANQCRTA